MANRDYDREYDRDYDRDYERRDHSRSRGYERSEEDVSDRSSRDRSDRYASKRRQYVDRDPMPEENYSRRYGREGAPVSDYAEKGNVALYSPKSYMDVQDMIEHLRRNEAIIVDLEGIETESAQRILDFLSGASYALGGSMRRVKKEMHATFLVTPQGTGIVDTDDDGNSY